MVPLPKEQNISASFEYGKAAEVEVINLQTKIPIDVCHMFFQVNA
jgi:hypothetical protein